MPDADLKHRLEALEEALWRPETRFDRSWMDRTLAAGFFEFGRSGRIYDRETIIASQNRPIRATLPLQNFAIHRISEDAVLATYVSRVIHDGVEQIGNRSSIWTKRDGSWRLMFHQGTPA